ncbi:Uncharacterized conserved protein [Bordetella ansorpii]|uniref:Uncharacterized conserved protein n=1 Tax=Bordetella ansorpii TaxID=288768 RepID=A0A157KRP4_9BORD|nr:YkvA family protein [Bordetella ansorpii]SAH87094.1 Uncharacterized conserved protein [Bordetella ansorpii]
MPPVDTASYENAYSERRFWRKLSGQASAAGRQALEKALWLYYAAQSPDTPKWARRTIYGALGYFVLPLDAIPDFAPLVGYTDDLTVMAAALTAVAFSIDDKVKQRANDTLARWRGGKPLAEGAVHHDAAL